MMLLLHLYPHTGLGRIISIPSTIIINLILSLGGCFLINMIRIRQTRFIIIWILITLIVTLLFYPQDEPRHVISLILEDIFSK